MQVIESDQQENHERLLEAMRRLDHKFQRRVCVVFDADRTLSAQDTGRNLIKSLDLDLNRIKAGFQKYGYTYPGFYEATQIYNDLDIEQYVETCDTIAQSTKLYEGVYDCIQAIQEFADVLIVTAGHPQIWKKIMELQGLNVPVIGGKASLLDNFLVGRAEKGIIVEYLKSKGRQVVCFGDSDVDSLMFEYSDIGVVVVNHRQNHDLIEYLKSRGLGHKLELQISYNEYSHDNIAQVKYSAELAEDLKRRLL